MFIWDTLKKVVYLACNWNLKYTALPPRVYFVIFDVLSSLISNVLYCDNDCKAEQSICGCGWHKSLRWHRFKSIHIDKLLVCFLPLFPAFPSAPLSNTCWVFAIGSSNDPLYKELWHACAGPLVTVPREGERVYYFPQGHMEQVSFSWLHFFSHNEFSFMLLACYYAVYETPRCGSGVVCLFIYFPLLQNFYDVEDYWSHCVPLFISFCYSLKHLPIRE